MLQGRGLPDRSQPLPLRPTSPGPSRWSSNYHSPLPSPTLPLVPTRTTARLSLPTIRATPLPPPRVGRDFIFSPRSPSPPTPEQEREATLTLAEMDREISRIETEFKLSGVAPRKLGARKPSMLLSIAPTSPPTSAASVASDLGDSPGLVHSLEFPAPPGRTVDDITPRTARRWSIVEVELAYERMKALVGSTRSLGLSTIDDGGSDDGTTPWSASSTPSRLLADQTSAASFPPTPVSPTSPHPSPPLRHSTSERRSASSSLASSSTSPSALSSSPATSGGPSASPKVSLESLHRSNSGESRKGFQNLPKETVLPPKLSTVTVGETWFPATPGRAAHRISLQAAPTIGSERPSEQDSISTVKGMDKLEVFFKYTATKAELEKATVERDALMDALKESRAALADVRDQRDSLKNEVRNLSKQLKKAQNIPVPLVDTSCEELEHIERKCQLWESRAREAIASLSRTKAELEERRRQAREDQLAREDDTVVISHLPRHHQRSSSAAAVVTSPSKRGYLLNGNPTSPPASPIRAGSPRSLKRFSHQSAMLDSYGTPAAKLITAYRDRPVSTDSSPGLNVLGLGELGSPILGQTMEFGPKSSYGSSLGGGSPLKSRTPGPRPLLLSSASSLSINGKKVRKKASRDSVVSVASSDYGDHLPPPQERGWNPVGSVGSIMTGLAEEDDRFLSDLSGLVAA